VISAVNSRRRRHWKTPKEGDAGKDKQRGGHREGRVFFKTGLKSSIEERGPTSVWEKVEKEGRAIREKGTSSPGGGPLS